MYDEPVDNHYHFLKTEAEPATNMGKPMCDHTTAVTIGLIKKFTNCLKERLRAEIVNARSYGIFS